MPSFITFVSSFKLAIYLENTRVRLTFSRAFRQTPAWAVCVGSWWTLGAVAHRWDSFPSLCVSLVSPSPKMKLTLNTDLLCWHFRPRRSKIAAPLGHKTDLSQDAAYFLSHIVWWVRNWDLNLQWIHWLYKRCVAAKAALTEEHGNSNLPMHPVTFNGTIPTRRIFAVPRRQIHSRAVWQCRMFVQASTPSL